MNKRELTQEVKENTRLIWTFALLFASILTLLANAKALQSTLAE
jgi:hypothetical protein